MSTHSASRISHPAIAFIGGGNMARSLIGGLIRNGTPAAAIAVAEPNPDLRAALTQDFAVATHQDNDAATKSADVLVLAVKPQVMKTVCAGLRGIAQVRQPLIVSIAAGIRVSQLDAWLGGNLAIVRCMPNTPALIGTGAAGLCPNPACTAAQRELAQSILSAAGLAVWINDEAQMDTVTALSGSGPAYFFLLTEALIDAAVAQGLPRETARELATQTCLGAGRMLREDGATPADLRRRVTSPNGTTQAALDSFAADGFGQIVARAITAATRRGIELSTQLNIEAPTK
ncbi:MAG: pyrroline-5-carboxylate reductase [Xanthomonadaceae bacterium]|nr:pyrroline-5-carboxylate reductase [Xanthomonadaceae bacterium]